MAKRNRTSGREATKGVIPGRYSLSVGNPATATPPGWAWKPLLEVARLESGHTPSRRHPEYWDGDIPWIGIKDARAHHGREIHQTNECCTELGIANSAARVLPPGTVCLSRTASIGYIFRLGRPMATSQDFVNWVCDPAQLDPKFLMYVLLADVESLFRFAHGSTHQTIYYPEVKAFHACLPPLPTQRRIAGILSAYDDLIENNTKRIKILEEMARALYREWFVHFRFPGHEKVKLLDSPLGQIPEGWDVGPLSTLVEEFFDGPHATPPPAESGPIFLGIKNITESGQLDLGKVRHIAEEDFPRWTKRVTPAAGDIVLSYEATLNRYAVIPEGFRGCLGRRLALIRPDAHALHYLFLSFFARRWRDTVEMRTVSGSTVNRIPLKKLPEFPILLPPADRLAKFDDAVAPIIKLQEVLRKQSRSLRGARDLLLPRLISGEIDVDAVDLPEAAE